MQRRYCDREPGIARGMAMMIAVYAAISKELGHLGNFRQERLIP